MNNRKVINTREAQKILRKNGYEYQYCKGSHFHYAKNGNVIVINKDINAMVWKRLVKENNLIV